MAWTGACSLGRHLALPSARAWLPPASPGPPPGCTSGALAQLHGLPDAPVLPCFLLLLPLNHCFPLLLPLHAPLPASSSPLSPAA